MSNHRISKFGNTYNNNKPSPKDAYHAPTLRFLRCRLPSGKWTIYRWFTYWKWWSFPIALSNYQRVPPSQISGWKEKQHHKFTRIFQQHLHTSSIFKITGLDWANNIFQTWHTNGSTQTPIPSTDFASWSLIFGGQTKNDCSSCSLMLSGQKGFLYIGPSNT